VLSLIANKALVLLILAVAELIKLDTVAPVVLFSFTKVIPDGIEVVEVFMNYILSSF